MNAKSFLGSFVVGIIVGGVAIGMFAYQIGYDNARTEIRDRLEQTGLVPTQKPAESTSISGTVVSAGKDAMTVEVSAPYDPTGRDRTTSTFTVTLTPETRIFTREMNYQAVPKPNVPFNPVIEKKATKGDVAVGASVTVEASTNIQSTSFTAVRIVINK